MRGRGPERALTRTRIRLHPVVVRSPVDDQLLDLVAIVNAIVYDPAYQFGGLAVRSETQTDVLRSSQVVNPIPKIFRH